MRTFDEKREQAMVWFGLLRLAEFVKNRPNFQLAINVNKRPQCEMVSDRIIRRREQWMLLVMLVILPKKKSFLVVVLHLLKKINEFQNILYILRSTKVMKRKRNNRPHTL